MSSRKHPITLAIAGTLALSGSAFAMDDLAGGYMQDAAQAPPAAHDAGEGSCGMDKMDTDKDGRISKAEFAAAHDGKDDKFAAHDPDGDGFISAAEMDAHHKAGGDKTKAEGKCGEGKCGEGKCGGDAGKKDGAKADAKADAAAGDEAKAEAKAGGEGKCGGTM